MLFGRFTEWLDAGATRRWVALAATYVALVAAGGPCVVACSATAAGAIAHDADHVAGCPMHAGGADDHDGCPSGSVCDQPIDPALAAHADGLDLTPPDAASIPVPVAVLAASAMSVAPGWPHPAPDRSPPIPPGFSSLRI